MGELLELDGAVTLAFNPSDHGDQLLVTRIEAALLQESVKVEVIDEALPLAVQEVEGGPRVPIRALVQLVLEHLDFDMDIEFALEEVGQACLDRWVQLLAALDIDLEGLALADVLSQLGIIAWEHELHEFRVGNTAAVVEVVELHHQLHIFDAELRAIVVLQVLINVVGVYHFVAVAVDTAEGGVRLEVVQVGEVLPCLLDAELEIGEVPEEVDQFLLRLSG